MHQPVRSASSWIEFSCHITITRQLQTQSFDPIYKTLCAFNLVELCSFTIIGVGINRLAGYLLTFIVLDLHVCVKV